MNTILSIVLYMKSQFRFYLEKGSKKFVCPNCNRNSLVRYLSTETSEYLPIEYGRCDREIKCGYHVNPYLKKNFGSGNQHNRIHHTKQNYNLPLTPIPYSVLKKTHTGYELNIFIQNLLNNVPFPFLISDIEKVISHYQLGTVTNGNRIGAITFPYIDINNKIRAIQTKQFDVENHTISTDFIHSIFARELEKMKKPQPEWLSAYLKQEKRVTCLFGEHLLSKYPENPVALVEAPKSAIYGALYFGFPDQRNNLLWLAVYNLSSLNYEKCKVLEDRKVFLFPDLSINGFAFDLWKRKAAEIQSRIKNSVFTVSDLLEKSALLEQKKIGYDIADYLIQMDWRNFRKCLS